MQNYRKIILCFALIAAAAVLISGCGAKPAGGKASPAISPSAQHSAAAGKATASAGTAPASAATPSLQPTGSAVPAVSSTASQTPSPSPAPTPSPTDPPEGTVVDGWVVGIPSYVPQFPYGTIDRSQSKITEGSVGSLFSLSFKDVTKANVDSYAEALKTAGFTVAVGEINSVYTLTASLSGDWNNATLVITLSEATGVAVYSLDVPV